MVLIGDMCRIARCRFASAQPRRHVGERRGREWLGCGQRAGSGQLGHEMMRRAAAEGDRPGQQGGDTAAYQPGGWSVIGIPITIASPTNHSQVIREKM